MIITSLKLENVRCFEEVVIELDNHDRCSSLLIAGNNGSGKSAILRSIAMGLCDQASAGSLLRELLGDFIRKEKTEDSNEERSAIITINVKDETTDKSYSIETKIVTKKILGFETVTQTIRDSSDALIEQDEFPWQRVFVTAYGAGLRTESTENYSQYFAADAVYSLFKYDHRLQIPELVWRRLVEVACDLVGQNKREEKEKIVNKQITDALLTITNIENEEGSDKECPIKLKYNGIFFKGGWGNEQELSALGDGYRALTTVVMDILSWQLLFKNHDVIMQELEENTPGYWKSLDLNNDLKGIIIIDEIEKHLHPKLQRFVINQLDIVFPNIQFIISSHSPLCVAGTADVENKYAIYRTRKNDDGKYDALHWGEGIAGLRTDQILEHFFDVPYINEKVLVDIERYSQLFLKKEKSPNELEKGELEELARLENYLKENAMSSLVEADSYIISDLLDSTLKSAKKLVQDSNE